MGVIEDIPMKPPTLADQISHAKAPKGSPLEKMISENQDFTLLGAEEFADKFPIPLWLRVAWRKRQVPGLPGRTPDG